MNFSIALFVISLSLIIIAWGVSTRHEPSAEQVTANIVVQRDTDIDDMAMLHVIDHRYLASTFSQRMTMANCRRAAQAIAAQKNLNSAECVEERE
jgi:hypothetical protein